MRRRSLRSHTLLLFFAAMILLACDIGGIASKPVVIIASPPSGSQFREGEDVAIQTTSTDTSGVARVELSVDGAVVRTDPLPSPQVSYPLIQTWKATAGAHTLSVRAYNAGGAVSDPAAVTITVSASASTPSAPTSAAVVQTTAPSGGCTNTAAFVADVTIPDGTVLAPSQTFNKIWRVRNSGTCAWEAGYQFVFVGGEALTTTTAVSVPVTAPGATADLQVPMTASAVPGTHAGQWRLKTATGALFGSTLTISINVVASPPPASATPVRTATARPAGCSGAPVIASFTVTSAAISPGATTTLQWGAVTNADMVEIDQGIGGVATPGNTTVSPPSTTTYTMTARCGPNTATRTVTIVVGTPAPATVSRCFVTTESGTVKKTSGGNEATAGANPIAGDDFSKNSLQAFFSFDIHDLAVRTIDFGALNIGAATQVGRPFDSSAGLSPMYVDILDYGTLDAADYDAGSTNILSLTSAPSGQFDVKSAIQSAVGASKARLQMRFRFNKATNDDSTSDSLTWAPGSVCLTITYR